MRFLTCRVAAPVAQMLVLWSVCVGVAIASETASHDEQPAYTDQILEVSTRGYACNLGRGLDFDTFRTREIGIDGSSTPNRLPVVADDSFTHTWIFVHGNQISASEAIRRGVMVYHKLRRESTQTGPVRFVIWSWPSIRNVGRIRDARQKATRTDVESFLLGSYLAKTSGEVISLVGHSFGARIITGAVHLAGGGSLAGGRLSELPDESTRIRVSLLAAAVEQEGLLPGGRYGQALDRMDGLLLMNNSRDKALNFFWIIDPRHKPRALGDTGLACTPQAAEVQQFDWARVIGREHSFMEYMKRPAIMNRVSDHMSQ